jgi:hypothetical protein
LPTLPIHTSQDAPLLSRAAGFGDMANMANFLPIPIILPRTVRSMDRSGSLLRVYVGQPR